MLCSFLPYNNANQPELYISLFPLEPPSPRPTPRIGGSRDVPGTSLLDPCPTRWFLERLGHGLSSLPPGVAGVLVGHPFDTVKVSLSSPFMVEVQTLEEGLQGWGGEYLFLVTISGAPQGPPTGQKVESGFSLMPRRAAACPAGRPGLSSWSVPPSPSRG